LATLLLRFLPTSSIAKHPIQEFLVFISLRAAREVTLPYLVAAGASEPRHVADLVNISSTGGRVARPGTAVYSLTKFGVNALSESLRQELLANRIRVSVVEPGTVATELASHTREELKDGIARMTESIELLRPEDIAEAITYIVTRDRRVAINEILIRAAEQTW
jgi:NADP-dependent 3-hydroxy acid dehydrogenase YdfG